MYQYNEVLGLPVFENHAVTAPIEEEEPGIDAMIAARLAAGEIEEAITIAKNAARDEAQSIAAQERLHKLLTTAGQTEKGSPARNSSTRALPGHKESCPCRSSLYRQLTYVRRGRLELQAEQILPLAKLANKRSRLHAGA